MLKKVFKIFVFLFFGNVAIACAEPVSAFFASASAAAPAIGQTVLAALPFFFSGGKDDEDDSDIARIRAQLQALALGIPELKERGRALRERRFALTEEKGLEDIAEFARAERGFGALGSLERGERTDLRERLTIAREEADLRAELGGLGLQASILGGAGSLAAQEAPEEPSFLEDLLGFGGEQLGEEFSFGRMKGLFDEKEAVKPKLLKDVVKPVIYEEDIRG